MARARLIFSVVLTLTFAAAPAGRLLLPSSSDPTPLHHVASSGVEALLPPKWEFRPLPAAEAHRNGIQASNDLAGWSPTDLAHPGLEAYWVDATEIGVPSDYYELAARGPVQDLLHQGAGCSSEMRRVAAQRRHTPGEPPWSGHYVATVTGTCGSGERDHGGTLWASVVAAPGFGPVHELGIPRSGLYVVTAAVRDGPTAAGRLTRLMSGVSFGGTPVGELLAAAGLSVKLP